MCNLKEYNSLDDVINFVNTHKSQSHLCICNTSLFDLSVKNGIYGFPHSGQIESKSFWRAITSMYNIGPNDLIFLYRTNGYDVGCKEIHGPFKIYTNNNKTCIFYDEESTNFTIKIDGVTDCKVRFLFEKFCNDIYSIIDNYELIKSYEKKEIWGYRHPAVMNIGAARKKSVTSFSYKQTLKILEIMMNYGTIRYNIKDEIPLKNQIAHYNSLNSGLHFRLDDNYILNSETSDEAFIYSYILNAIKNYSFSLYKQFIDDFSIINDNILIESNFKKISQNAMVEVVITPHLQDELDIVFMDEQDSNILFFEIKNNYINQTAINQTVKYIDLLKVIFPNKNIYANIIGVDKEMGTNIPLTYASLIKLVSYRKDASEIRFIEL